MNRTTDSLVYIILDKRMRKVLDERRRTGKLFKNIYSKPNLRDLNREKEK